ncbi:hypothetical protein B0H19DRAFT_1074130 [Mycena capillaripes]|nr:hypothetical protein B0H19DRAFT_1074130 [Mycena capillaripes]
MLASLVFTAILAAVANADRRITLRNNCAFAVGMTLSNFPHSGVDYTGPPIPDIPAFSSQDVTVPTGWNGRICDHPPNSVSFGQAGCSMTEWNFDAVNIGGQTDYDISNIQGFSVAQKIIPDDGCAVVACTGVDCACDQAYRPGDISGTCGGTGPVDQATRTCGSPGYTVVFKDACTSREGDETRLIPYDDDDAQSENFDNRRESPGIALSSQMDANTLSFCGGRQTNLPRLGCMVPPSDDESMRDEALEAKGLRVKDFHGTLGFHGQLDIYRPKPPARTWDQNCRPDPTRVPWANILIKMLAERPVVWFNNQFRQFVFDFSTLSEVTAGHVTVAFESAYNSSQSSFVEERAKLLSPGERNCRLGCNVTTALRSPVPCDSPSISLAFTELNLTSPPFSLAPLSATAESPSWVTVIWRMPDSMLQRWFPRNPKALRSDDLTQPRIFRCSSRALPPHRLPHSQARAASVPAGRHRGTRNYTGRSVGHFEINGKALYTNTIPFDPFYARTTTEKVRRVLESAVRSGSVSSSSQFAVLFFSDEFNTQLRILGGGIYQPDSEEAGGYDFYSICDELGILTWSEFIFSDALYPLNDIFLESIEPEVFQNVRRISKHPSNARWAGGNEIGGLVSRRCQMEHSMWEPAGAAIEYSARWKVLQYGSTTAFSPLTIYQFWTPDNETLGIVMAPDRWEVVDGSLGGVAPWMRLAHPAGTIGVFVDDSRATDFILFPELIARFGPNLGKTVIQQSEVRWVGWAGMKSRYSGTPLQLHLAPLGLLTFSDIMQCFYEKKNGHIQGLFFLRAALHNAQKPHAAPYGFAQPV